MTTLQIEIEEIRGTPKVPGSAKYQVYFKGEPLLVSRKPFVDSARAILSAGYPEDARLEMVRRGSSQVDLSGELGPTGKTTVTENSRAGPYFTEYRPFEELPSDPSEGGDAN